MRKSGPCPEIVGTSESGRCQPGIVPIEPDRDVHLKWMGVIEPVRAVMLDLIDQRETRRELHNGEATPESPAMRELHQTRALIAYVGMPVIDAYNHADLLLAAADDHLLAMSRLHEHEAAVMFADKVLARAAVEACGRAVWLADPQIDATRRAHRALTQRFCDIEGNRKLVGAPIAEQQQRRRDDLISQCNLAGVPVKRHEGTATVGTDGYPSAGSAMRYPFGGHGNDSPLGKLAQSWLSRFVHSSTAGLMENRLDDVPAETGRPDRPGQGTYMFGSDATITKRLITLCSMAYLNATEMQVRQMGWGDDDWKKVATNARRLLSASNV